MKKLDIIALAIYSFLLPFIVGVELLWESNLPPIMIDGGHRFFDILQNILTSIILFENIMVSIPFYLAVLFVTIIIWRK